jgi:hypothetical protein
MFSLFETRKLNLPNGQTQRDYRFFLQELIAACVPSYPFIFKSPHGREDFQTSPWGLL